MVLTTPETIYSTSKDGIEIMYNSEGNEGTKISYTQMTKIINAFESMISDMIDSTKLYPSQSFMHPYLKGNHYLIGDLYLNIHDAPYISIGRTSKIPKFMGSKSGADILEEVDDIIIQFI